MDLEEGRVDETVEEVPCLSCERGDGIIDVSVEINKSPIDHCDHELRHQELFSNHEVPH